MSAHQEGANMAIFFFGAMVGVFRSMVFQVAQISLLESMDSIWYGCLSGLGAVLAKIIFQVLQVQYKNWRNNKWKV